MPPKEGGHWFKSANYCIVSEMDGLGTISENYMNLCELLWITSSTNGE